MFDILINNYLLIINILIPFMLGFVFLLMHKKYSLNEFLIQSAFTTFVLFAAFSIGYSSLDIYTKTYGTTKIKKVVYEESWTEKVTYTESYSCGKGGKDTCYRTKTRYDYHPDEYYYTTNSIFERKSLSKKEYEVFKEEFGEYLTNRRQSNQVSYGDGRIYEINLTKDIVHSFTKRELNYIYASKKNIIKSPSIKELETMYANELVEYPKFKNGYYSNTTFDRIINKHLIDKELAKKLQDQLELISINLNANPMIYLTTSTSREFAYVVKGFYQDKYFDDAMLIISVTDNKINWIEPLSLSKSASFKVHSTDLTDNFDDLVAKFKNVIDQHWEAPNLEDYSYLAGDINLPLWYEILIVILNIIGSFFLFRYMFENEI